MTRPSLRSISAAVSTALAITLGAAASSALALGSIADINVVDRTTGQVLPVYTYQGRHYVAGRPGARYAVRVHNRAGDRVMTVVAVDGINVVSGDTASWEQNGYVLAARQRHDIAGWRKSQSEVAAFEFTALPNSYAARTGRPENVGVIGVAVFRERSIPPAPPPRPYGALRGSADTASASGAAHDGGAARAGGAGEAPASARDDALGNATRSRAESPAMDSAPAPSASRKSTEGIASAEGRALSRPAPQAESKLGTGHGAREHAWVQYTEFERASSQPSEVITIYYDSRDNLIAQGVIPAPRIYPAPPVPQAFPVAPQTGFVPDPPRL